jgi:hypothetical protein
MKKKANHPTLGIVLLLIIFNLYYLPLSAQNEIPDSLVTIRLQYLKQTLEHDRANTKQWWYGWLAGYSAATIGQGMVYLNSTDLSTRQDMALGAATTLLGAAGQFISPLIPGDETEQLNAVPETSGAEKLSKLTLAEKLLYDCGKREKLARNWKNHAMCSAVNLGSGMITWLGFKRSIGAGIGNFVLNTVITETQIWTQPTLARRSYIKYRQKYPDDGMELTYVPAAKWYIGSYPGGVGIKVVF